MRSTGSARAARRTSRAGLREGYALADDAFRATGSTGSCSHPTASPTSVSPIPTSSPQMIRDDADRGINLVTVGFGMGNFNDVTMEQLADQGDGFYAYVDTEDEAERLFEDELTSTLLTIAKDAKIQVEFDAGGRRRVPADRVREPWRARPATSATTTSTPASSVPATRSPRCTRSSSRRGVVARRPRRPRRGVPAMGGPDDGEVIEIDEDIDLRDVEARLDATREPTSSSPRSSTVFAELMRDNPYADRIDIDDLVDEADRLADELDDRDVDDLADLIERAAELR